MSEIQWCNLFCVRCLQMVQKCALSLWHHHISHLLQSFGDQTLRYEFEIWHANCSHVGPIHIIRFFWKNWKFWIFQHFSQKNLFLKFWGQNKKLKIWDSHLVENSIFFVLTPFVCDLLQNTLICDWYSWQPFLAQNHMTWRHWNVIFSKNFQPNLAKFPDKVSNWCLIRYWKFGGNIICSCQVSQILERGQNMPPTPSGAGLSLLNWVF